MFALVNIFTSKMNNLNPDIWKSKKRLHNDVYDKLIQVSKFFLKKIETPMEIKNIFLTGSIASYQWTPLSDIDLHIIVDVLNENCEDTIDDYFDVKSKNFNKTHNIYLKGFKVEINIKREEVLLKGKAVYDLLNKEWVAEPVKPTKDFTDHEVLTIVSRIQKDIDDAINNREPLESFDDIRNRIKEMRNEGLKSEDGEFSVGNLVFKTLRNNGYIEKLFKYKGNILDDVLSLESFKVFYKR